jgi:hypothetical protein
MTRWQKPLATAQIVGHKNHRQPKLVLKLP